MYWFSDFPRPQPSPQWPRAHRGLSETAAPSARVQGSPELWGLRCPSRVQTGGGASTLGAKGLKCLKYEYHNHSTYTSQAPRSKHRTGGRECHSSGASSAELPLFLPCASQCPRAVPVPYLRGRGARVGQVGALASKDRLNAPRGARGGRRGGRVYSAAHQSAYLT